MYEARPTLDQARPMLVNTNSDETLFYSFTVTVTFSISVKYGEVCNFIDDPFVRAYILNKVENVNLKVFNLMSQVNEARFLV